jgi:DNA polymerase I
MSNKKLFLLDGHALVYRAHYAFMQRPLINSKGINTSAITGFVRALWDILQKQKPSHIAVAFDLSAPKFRLAAYPEYKANRDAQPEDITVALPYIINIVKAFNIPIIVEEGYEADDVIGTVAKQAEKEGFNVYMVTPDKDFGQIVSDKIFMYKPSRNGDESEVWGEKEVTENWQIKHTSQVIDILGLQGDAVDNIPGVPGIGPKTAAKLLEQFGSIENIIANAASLPGKQKEQFTKYADQALLSKQLATIDLKVPIQFDAETYKIDPINREKLSEIFKELEFRGLATTILGAAEPVTSSQKAAKSTQKPANPDQFDLFAAAFPTENDTKTEVAAPENPTIEPTSAAQIADNNAENTPHTYHLVDTFEKRKALIEQLSLQTAFCFDTETTNIDATLAEMVGISFAFKAFEAYYVPIPVGFEEAKAMVHEFKEVLEDEKIEKIGQNLKYDLIVLKHYGVEAAGKVFDTMVAHYLIEPELRHNLNFLSETYLNYAPIQIESLIGKKGKDQLNMRDVALEKIKEYAAEDADVTLQLREILSKKLKTDNLDTLYETVEAPLVRVLADLEYEGIKLNADALRVYSKELALQILELEGKIYEAAGTKFNIASPKQVGETLFDKLKIPYTRSKTKTGQYSTDEEILNDIPKSYKIVALILEYRSLAKLKSTYVDALPEQINPRTGRLHSSFNQALTATGRLSSNNPNLQNIPIRTAEGRKVRAAFVPRDENHVLLSADYSQIELRLIAEISSETAMLEAFQAGHDIHRATAAKVYNTPLDEVSADQRRNAKTVNFSIIYGAGAHNLSKQLDISRTEAKVLIDQYFESYQGLKKYMDTIVDDARKQEFVVTLLGRRRFLRDINSRNSLARGNAERMAINTPIQGTAADMIKVAMVNIHNSLKNNGLQSKMILQVHDELVFDVLKTELAQVKDIVQNEMRTAIPNLKVPILVETGVGESWLEAH